MSRMKCIDIAKMALDAQTEEVSGVYSVNPKRMTFVDEFCSGLDEFVDGLFKSGEENVSFSTDVNEETMDIEFSVSCSTIFAEKNNVFFELMLNSKSVSFENDAESKDTIIVKFIVDGIWDLICEE